MKKSKFDLLILFIFSVHLFNLFFSFFRTHSIEWFSLFIVLVLLIMYIHFHYNKLLEKNKKSNNKE